MTVTADSAAPFVVEGLGAVGMRVARELAATHGLASAILRSGHSARLDAAAEAFGERVRPWSPTDERSGGTVIIAREAEAHPELARRHLAAGRNVVSCADEPDTVRELLELDEQARAAERALVVGAAFSPGLSCLLVRHAVNALGAVRSVSVSMVGAGGPSCVARRHVALQTSAPVWRAGEWDTPSKGTKLTWFPDPVGAVDVGPGALAEPLLIHRALPAVDDVVASAAIGSSRVGPGGLLRRVPLGRRRQSEPLGAIRVEVVGDCDGEETMIVYAVVDRPAAAAAALATVVALDVDRLAVGVTTVADVPDPLPWLRELARRGIKAATFESAV